MGRTPGVERDIRLPLPAFDHHQVENSGAERRLDVVERSPGKDPALFRPRDTTCRRGATVKEERVQLPVSDKHFRRRSAGLLCVANFKAGTGFAWSFIEQIYADVAERLSEDGINTFVAYPELEIDPEPLRDSPARPIEFAVRPGHPGALLKLIRLVRRRNIKVLYLPDRPVWHPAYAVLRAAGVRTIVVHDHTSGERTPPTGVKRTLKKASRRLPGMLADRVIGVSDYVVRRKVEVDLVPPERVARVWNGISIPADYKVESDRNLIADRLDLPSDRPIIACACRAAREKGVQHLLSAFRSLLEDDGREAPRPLLVYFGDGPALAEWRLLAADLALSSDVVFAGYREDASELVGDAAIAVVPSIWAEAFGLSALEPMVRAVPVVASRVGGLPEVVADGETGILVPPANEESLAEALRSLLDDDQRRREMGRKGRVRAERYFSWDDQVAAIATLLEEGFE